MTGRMVTNRMCTTNHVENKELVVALLVRTFLWYSCEHGLLCRNMSIVTGKMVTNHRCTTNHVERKKRLVMDSLNRDCVCPCTHGSLLGTLRTSLMPPIKASCWRGSLYSWANDTTNIVVFSGLSHCCDVQTTA